MKATAITLPRKSARLTGAPSCEVNVNSGAGAIFGSCNSENASSRESCRATSITDASITSVKKNGDRMSALQLALELVEESPIRAVSNDLVGIGLDHASLPQPQRIESDRVLGVVVAPLVVRDFFQCLQRVIIPGRKPAIDHPSRGTHWIADAEIGRLEDRAQHALGRDGVGSDEFPVT